MAPAYFSACPISANHSRSFIWLQDLKWQKLSSLQDIRRHEPVLLSKKAPLQLNYPFLFKASSPFTFTIWSPHKKNKHANGSLITGVTYLFSETQLVMSLYLKKEGISVILMPRRFEWDQLDGPAGQGQRAYKGLYFQLVSFKPLA